MLHLVRETSRAENQGITLLARDAIQSKQGKASESIRNSRRSLLDHFSKTRQGQANIIKRQSDTKGYPRSGAYYLSRKKGFKDFLTPHSRIFSSAISAASGIRQPPLSPLLYSISTCSPYKSTRLPPRTETDLTSLISVPPSVLSKKTKPERPFRQCRRILLSRPHNRRDSLLRRDPLAPTPSPTPHQHTVSQGSPPPDLIEKTQPSTAANADEFV